MHDVVWPHSGEEWPGNEARCVGLYSLNKKDKCLYSVLQLQNSYP